MKKCPQCQADVSDNDVFCQNCGYRLIPESTEQQPQQEQPPVEQPPVEQPPVEQPPVEQPPVEQPPVEQPPVEQPPVVQPPVVPPVNEQAQTPPIQQQAQAPVSPPVTQQAQTPPPVISDPPPVSAAFSKPPKKKGKAGKVILLIVLILFGVVIIGGGISGYMIYKGNISRDVAGKFLPGPVLNLIPSCNCGHAQADQTYFMVYSLLQTGKDKKDKKAVLSDIFTSEEIGSDTKDAAEVAFRNAGREQIEGFHNYTRFFVVSYSLRADAHEKRQEQIDDFREKGYKMEFVKVSND